MNCINPEIGVKVLIPKFEDPGVTWYLQKSDNPWREWDMPGGRMELEDSNATAAVVRETQEETGHELTGDIVPIAIQWIDRSAERQNGAGPVDVARFTAVSGRQDEERLKDHGRWFTRAQIAELAVDRPLKELVREDGPLDRLEKSGQITLGTAAIKKFVREQQLLG